MTVNNQTDIGICSAALALLGQDPISSLTDPKTDIESTCALIYPITIKALLSRYSWNFSNPIKQLAANIDITNLRGKLYAYTLPSDLIAGPHAVYANGYFKRSITDYENADDHIFCDHERIDIKYSIDADPKIWPAYFSDLAIHAVAARLCKPVTNENGLTNDLNTLAFGTPEQNGSGGLFLIAKQKDAAAQPIRSLFDRGDPFTMSRY